MFPQWLDQHAMGWQHKFYRPIVKTMRWQYLIFGIFPVACFAAEPSTRIIGGPGVGCIAGAIELPSTGPGYVTIRQTRSSFWGAPSTIASIELLAREAQQAGMGMLYMNDISLPHGGPMVGLHASHMIGLDADVWLDTRPKPALTPMQREWVEVESLVSADGRGVDPARWQRSTEQLIRMATALPGVDRVLVNAAIKKQLCLTVPAGPDRQWLHLVRPWYGHTAHMHVHFRCPPGQTECHDQAPPPPGDGCDATLEWWFARLDQPAAPAGPPGPVTAGPRLPAACAGVMAGLP